MPETFTTTNDRGREVDHERLSDDEVTEQHLAAFEANSGDANLVRLLRHLGSELMKVRGGGDSQAAEATAGNPEAIRRRDAEARRAQLQRELDDLNRDNPATTPDAAPVNASTPPPPPGQQPEMRSFQTPSGNAALAQRSDA